MRSIRLTILTLAIRVRNSLEFVREVYVFKHSFLSMRRIDAKSRKARAVLVRFSKSLASRRHLPSQANVLSTTHRLGMTSKPTAAAKASQGATLALFHPSKFLIETTDPLKGRHATQAQARATVKRQLVTRLKQLGIAVKPPRKSDSARRKPAWQVLAAIEKTDGTFEHNQAAWKSVSDDDGVLSTLLGRRTAVSELDWVSTRELNDLAAMAHGGSGIVAGRA